MVAQATRDVGGRSGSIEKTATHARLVAHFTPSIVIASPRNEGAAIQPLDRLAALSLSNGLRSFF
jgi:hypothetical protein